MRSYRKSGFLWIGLLLVVSILITHRLLRSPEVTFSRPNILWITMDSMRSDHLGCAGYHRAHTPNIDALAGEGILFTESISQSTFTRISVPSMITGKYPFYTGLRMMALDLDSSNVTLAEVLTENGYFTYGILESWRPGFFQGLEKFEKNRVTTLQKTKYCLEALDQLDDRPFFIWLYHWDPHASYSPPVDYMRIFEPEYTWEPDKPYSEGNTRVPNEELKDPSGLYAGTITVLTRINQGQIVPTRADVQHLINLYDAEIAFVDSQIQQVLDRVKELGLWENTIVILNADHGEAFGEHGRFFHGHSLYEEEIRVPLIIKPPQWQHPGKVVHGPVRNLDIMPTILDFCGLKIPKDIQGVSLRPFIEKDRSPNLPACIETHWGPAQIHLMGYRDERYKLIYNLPAGGAQLFDRVKDPGEQNNLLSQKADTTGIQEPVPQTVSQTVSPMVSQIQSRLEKELLATLDVKALAALRVGEVPGLMDPETKEQLKALGYIY